MINLNELSSKDLAKILKLRQQIEVYEAQMVKILKDAKIKGPTEASSVQQKLPRNAQPRQRVLISEILQQAGKPMSVAEVYDASVETGYQWRSKRPINALNVKMYTDKTFKKASPGKFVLRREPRK